MSQEAGKLCVEQWVRENAEKVQAMRDEAVPTTGRPRERERRSGTGIAVQGILMWANLCGTGRRVLMKRYSLLRRVPIRLLK